MTIKRSASVKCIGLHINENLNWIIHIDSLIMTLVKYFGIFNQQKDYVSNQLARKLYYAFVYSNISYGIEVYGSCSDTSLDRLQVIQNRLLKLLLRLDPCTSTNFLYSELNILKVRDLYNTSLLLFVHANLQGNCPAAVKNYFVRRNSTYNSRQTGHLEYRRERLDLGTSGVQYHAAELWNLLNDVIKNIPFRKHFKRSLCEKIVQGYIQWIIFIILILLGDVTSCRSRKRLSISTNDGDILYDQKVVPCYCYCCLILHFVISIVHVLTMLNST